MIARHAGDWARVVDAIGSLATEGGRATSIANHLMRWLTAEAYEGLNRPDSAAAFFELVVTPARMTWEELLLIGLPHSFAHRRLARLYTQMEQYNRAAEHWLTFLDTFTEPDPEYEWMVDEARRELERLGRGR
jgi:hypothetical protein